MITVYTVAYNESLLIQFMIDHYRERFPGCRIVVHDNMSTDDTAKIALANGCEIIHFDTNNQFQDRRHMEIKNTCWRDAKTDWVLMCDLDELLDINETELETEENSGATIIRAEGYEMINMEKDIVNIAAMKYGTRDVNYDKSYLFNKKFIKEMNYGPGCHVCKPVGIIRYSNRAYKLYHYSSLSEKTTIEKRRIYAVRLSPENLKEGWGTQCLLTPEQIYEEYAIVRGKATKIRM